MSEKDNSFKNRVINRLENSKRIHAVARACVVGSFLGLIGSANFLSSDQFQGVAAPFIGWLVFSATVDTLTTPGALRNK